MKKNKIYKILLRIINFIFPITFTALWFVSFLFMIFFIPSVIETKSLIKGFIAPFTFLEKFNSSGKIQFILGIILLIINIILIILIKRYNKKHNINEYRDVDSTKYVLLALFFGLFGAHKFLIKDKKRGILYIIIFILTLILNNIIPDTITILNESINEYLIVSLYTSMPLTDIIIFITQSNQ